MIQNIQVPLTSRVFLHATLHVVLIILGTLKICIGKRRRGEKREGRGKGERGREEREKRKGEE